MRFSIEVDYLLDGRKITQRWTPEIPPGAFISSMSAYAGGEPIVRTPFAYHGAGLHTLCQLNNDDETRAAILMLRYGGGL